MKKRAVILGIALLILACTAALADVAIDETNFPDPEFRERIAYEFDTDKDGKLSDAEIDAVTVGMFSEHGFLDMTGIGFFRNLTTLNCAYNQLTTLDVSKNTRLQYLYTSGNKLTKLDVSKNTKLIQMTCDNNQLKELDLSRNTNLEYLSCDNNPFRKLDVSKNKKLTYLSCRESGLTAIDVSKNTKLTCLDVSKNQLKSLDVSKNTLLQQLLCASNKLTGLSLGSNKKLYNLACDHNSLSSLDVSSNTELIWLWIHSNKISALDVSKCPDLCKYVRKDGRKSMKGYDYFGMRTGHDAPDEPFFTVDPSVTVTAGKTVSYPTATVNGLNYELNTKKKTAVFTGPANRKIKAVTVPDTVKAYGQTYKVTEIAAGACGKLPNLTKVTSGKNVSKIGKNAFNGSKKAATFVIKTKKLTDKSVGSGAFKTGCRKKTTVKCPKGKADAYEKILTKKGLDSKSKFTQ